MICPHCSQILSVGGHTHRCPPPIEQALRAKPVTQPWTHFIPLMQQTVLLTAVRGPDGIPKYGAIKMLLRWYRRCILHSAMLGETVTNPCSPDGGSFMGASLPEDSIDHWTDRMLVHVNQYLRELDGITHHFQLHFMHAVEIVGYKHPDEEIRMWWHKLYLRLANDMHLHPETQAEMDDRLGDSRSGWLKRADPATVE